MIYLNLPLLCDNYNFNNAFHEYLYKNKDVTKLPIQIESVYGSFPYCSWNGDVNSNYGNDYLYPQLSDFIINNDAIPIRLDFSNIYLINNDFYSKHENVILKLLESNGSIIELSNLDLYNYISSNYKGYDFICSNNANFIHPLNEDIINIFCEQDDFILISLKHIEQLDINKINQKSKIEIFINNECKNCPLEIQNNCSQMEQYNQIVFSNKSIHYNCPKKCDNYDDNNLFAEIEQYYKMGFNHFKIGAPNKLNNIRYFNRYLIKNLIKEEYINSCMKELEDYI